MLYSNHSGRDTFTGDNSQDPPTVGNAVGHTLSADTTTIIFGRPPVCDLQRGERFATVDVEIALHVQTVASTDHGPLVQVRDVPFSLPIFF